MLEYKVLKIKDDFWGNPKVQALEYALNSHSHEGWRVKEALRSSPWSSSAILVFLEREITRPKAANPTHSQPDSH